MIAETIIRGQITEDMIRGMDHNIVTNEPYTFDPITRLVLSSPVSYLPIPLTPTESALFHPIHFYPQQVLPYETFIKLVMIGQSNFRPYDANSYMTVILNRLRTKVDLRISQGVYQHILIDHQIKGIFLQPS